MRILALIIVILIVPICTLLSYPDKKYSIPVVITELIFLCLPIICIKLDTYIPLIILACIIIGIAVYVSIKQIIYLVTHPSDYY